MTLDRDSIIRALGVVPEISPATEVRNRINFLKEYAASSGANGFVLGISGGQASSLAGRLAQLSVRELREEGKTAEFVAVRLPYKAQRDYEDAERALEFIKPDRVLEFNIGDSVDSVAAEFAVAAGVQISDFNKGNVKARVRMVAQYALAASFGYLVIGTDHAAEAVTGFFTKFGDGGADLLPLSGLTKSQGRQLLIELQAPREIYEKIPTADLLDETPLQSDEQNLGISYVDIDDFLTGNMVSEAGHTHLLHRYQATFHKRVLPATPYDEWWRQPPR